MFLQDLFVLSGDFFPPLLFSSTSATVSGSVQSSDSQITEFRSSNRFNSVSLSHMFWSDPLQVAKIKYNTDESSITV